MTGLMFKLRRSPRTLLERDGHPGPGPGHIGLVMARAGVGKTAFLVGLGIDALLSKQNVLHISLDRGVDKVREWYDDLLLGLLQRERKVQHLAEIQLEIERHRHIHTYLNDTFSPERLRASLDLLMNFGDFVPRVIILDRLDFEHFGTGGVREIRDLAEEVGAELWLACRTHRDGPQAEDGHLPPPADAFERYIDTAFSLDPYDAKIRLHVLKDYQKMLDEDLNILLDPKTLLLETGFGANRS